MDCVRSVEDDRMTLDAFPRKLLSCCWSQQTNLGAQQDPHWIMQSKTVGAPLKVNERTKMQNAVENFCCTHTHVHLQGKPVDPVKVAEQQETRDALDAALHDLRREMLQVSSDCKGAEIKRLLLLQELQILQVRHLQSGLFDRQPAVGGPLKKAA